MQKYLLQRKKRKTLSMRLDEEGKVIVSAPLFCPKKIIDEFVQKNQEWIEKKRLEQRETSVLAKLRMENGALIPLFGEEYPLLLTTSRTIALTPEGLTAPQDATLQSLKKYYARRLRERVTAYIREYSTKMNVAPTSLKITSARTRWGSCSRKNALSFSFRLAMCKPSVVEYVAIHELCHIRYKNHSPLFWAEVEKYCPRYREAKKYLRENARFMLLI